VVQFCNKLHEYTLEDAIKAIAKQYIHTENAYFVGRNPGYEFAIKSTL
jgi:hypothetical protein